MSTDLGCSVGVSASACAATGACHSNTDVWQYLANAGLSSKWFSIPMSPVVERRGEDNHHECRFLGTSVLLILTSPCRSLGVCIFNQYPRVFDVPTPHTGWETSLQVPSKGNLGISCNRIYLVQNAQALNHVQFSWWVFLPSSHFISAWIKYPCRSSVLKYFPLGNWKGTNKIHSFNSTQSPCHHHNVVPSPASVLAHGRGAIFSHKKRSSSVPGKLDIIGDRIHSHSLNKRG